MTEDESSVRVAVRIRPQLAREVIDMCRVCTSVTPGEPQVTIGSDKSFTYDYVFDTDSDQGSVYTTTVSPLVSGSLSGYNATVLAYGQTGSGKTYTMGTGFEMDINPEQVGIIPRAIHQLFDGINNLAKTAMEDGLPPPQFKVTAQFLELYNEDIIDLFDTSHEYKAKGNIKIHEDSDHSIYVTGVRSERVGTAEEALSLLKKGALSRTTAATQMNCQSSRSHAIFTLHIRQQRLVQVEEEEEMKGEQEFETLSAKFHFVDLAGSERLKRTGATGDRAKEGIAINCGLLALGNVISALGDRSKRALHVPYRDSKLTRLLQDSLGGNSRTLMIACVSPSDRDFMETLNTLKYANRARNIQNKVVINQDKSSRTISLLKKEIQQLQLELFEYKQGKRMIGEDGNETVNDMFHENRLLQSELEALRTRVKGMQEVIDSLTARNTELLAERDIAAWAKSAGDGTKDDIGEMIKGYLTEIEGLRAKLVESESIVVQLKKEMSRASKFSARTDTSSLSESGIEEVLDVAKRDIQKDIEMIKANKPPPSTELSPSDSESSSSEAEEDGAGGQYSADIANLTSEISVKQRLIEALENTNKKLNLMKQQYEEKLMLLQAKISATERERDTVLASFSNVENKPTEKVKKIKDEYEKKLTDMQREMKSLLSAKKEHAKLLRNQSQYENQIRQLSSDVQEMKKTKVRLMKKMSEEAKKYKEVETRRNREIAQLKKKTRQDASMIKTLEAERKAKAIVLKRKQEEVSALRKAAQSRKFGRRHNQSSQAKYHWISLEKNIAEMAMSRHTAITLEKEMEKKIEARTELQEELNNKLAMLRDPRFANSSVLSEEVDSVRANLDHVQSAIADLQHEILQVEESKSSFECDDLLRLLIDIGEAPYILEKLYSMALHHSCMNAEKDATLRELQAENEQLKRESEMQEQLLKHLVEEKSIPGNGSSPPSTNSSRSPSPQPENRKKRQPRKTLAPIDLLFPGGTDTNWSQPKKGSSSATASPERLAPPPLLRSLTTIKVPSSAPGSPIYMRKEMNVSPKLTRRATYVISSSNFQSMERGLEQSGSPPGSPHQYRRQQSRDENVFSRLTSQPPSVTRIPGKITSFTFRRNVKTPILCTHVVEGHTRAVLALHATEDYLFTASRDRTVLVWDLRQMKETEMFAGHPNNVVAVKFEPTTRLVFAASSSYVKVWDLRSAKCIRTLFSSGMSASWSNQQNNNGDPQMNDIALGESGVALYTAAGDKVRVWDLRKFSVTGKLIGGHQAAVMCLAVGPDVVVTGSKDHYIKIFDIGTEGQTAPVGVLTPRVTLDPPHYDGIQCLELSSDVLFSGSRDGIIKKWNTETHELLCSLNGAHKDWVTGLCRTNTGLLASGCRDGTVKLWSPETCACIGEVKAHSSSINALASNSGHLFTASNSGDVMMWREAINEQDPMTMSTGHCLQLSA